MTQERRVVSILFADVVDSTALGAEHDPELIRGVMARYFARMTVIAEAHGGTVEKFIGDAVMVVFGVPRLHDDDAERAVRAALEMRDAVTELNRTGKILLSLRIGVNSGNVVAGVSDARQFLVTGDAVNVAARLQQGGAADEVVVGELTARLTRDAIEYQPLQPITAKGKAEPLTAFLAVRALTARPASRGGALAALASPIGRERELRLLMDTAARARRNRAGFLVTVVGSAGVGKSTLVAEALTRLGRADHVRILRGRCLPYGAGVTYWPLMDVIREDAGILATDDRAAALAKLDDRLVTLLPGDRLPAVRARIAVLLGLETPAAALPTVPAERLAAELSWGIRRHLESIAAAGPLVVVIDDLQWAEPTAIEVLTEIVLGPDPLALGLVCVARPELTERYPSWPTDGAGATLLALEPLERADTEMLVSGLLGVDRTPPEIATWVVERAAGNPLFCEEFVHMLVEARYLELVDGRWRPTQPLTELPLPASIQAIVAARIDGLPADEKATLQRASVIGERFALGDLIALDDVRGPEPDGLLRKGLLIVDSDDPSGASLRFKHLVIRDVAYESLSKADRAELHDRVGARLELAMQDRGDEFSDLLAHHAGQAYLLSRDLGLAGDEIATQAERAVRWAGRAGDRALALYATAQAASHYALAIEVGLRDAADPAMLEHLYVSRGRALELGGVDDEALAAYEALERLAVRRADPRLRADALAHQATIYRTPTTRFDAERAEQTLDAALEVARSLDDEILIAQLQRDRIHLRLYRGQVDEAITAGEDSLAAATRVGSQEQLMYTLNDIGCAYREAGQMDLARTAEVRAVALAEELGNQPMAANGRINQAMLAFCLGDYDVAMGLSVEALDITMAIGNSWGQSISLCHSAILRFEQGDLGGAIRELEEGQRLARAVGFLLPQAWYRPLLAWCYRAAGADRLARSHLDGAHDLVRTRFPFWRSLTFGHRARAAIARGATGDAQGDLAQARDGLATRTEFFAFQHAQVGLATVELKMALDDFEAAAAAGRSFGEEQSAMMRPYVADFEYLEGEALRLGGRIEEAGPALERARVTAVGVGGLRILWRILASLASVEDAVGNPPSAARLRAEARSIVAGIEQSLESLGLAESFRARPDVRALVGETPLPIARA